MSRVTKTLEASMKDRIDSYNDQELRSECINSGLKPGPVNSQTRSGWAKRLLSKRMKESKPAKQEAPKEVDAEFSADEDAINVEIIDVEGEGEEEAVVPGQKRNVLTEVSNVAITGDAEFSDDDAPVEEDGEEDEKTEGDENLEEKIEEEDVETTEEKSEENNDNKTDESMMVNLSKPDIEVNLIWKTADTSSMEAEATISGENNTEEEDVEEKMSEKSEEKTEPEVTDSESAEEKPESSDCKMMSCLKSHYESSCAYLQENKNEITELVVVLLIAYLLFIFKDNINETFERLNATAEQVFKPVKEQIVAVFKDLKAKLPAAFPEKSEVADAVTEPVAATEPSE